MFEKYYSSGLKDSYSCWAKVGRENTAFPSAEQRRMLGTDDASFQENMDTDKICPRAFAVCHDGDRMKTDRRTKRVLLNMDFKTRAETRRVSAGLIIHRNIFFVFYHLCFRHSFLFYRLQTVQLKRQLQQRRL